MKDFYRGDVIYVDLGQHPKSSVQSGIRPCIVVSNDKNNHYANVLSVCPCSCKLKDIPVHVRLQPKDVNGYFEKESDFLAEQIVTVDRRKVISKAGRIPKDSRAMQAIDNAIRLQLGLSSENKAGN